MQESYRLDGILTVVDAKHVEQHLEEQRADGAINETVQQLAFADRILLNKIDLVPQEADLARIEGRIRAINNFAPLTRTQNGKVPIDSVLGIRSFDLEKVLLDNPAFLEDTKSVSHDKGVSSFALNVKGSADLRAIQHFMNNLLDEQGENLYRMKGILSIDGVDQRYVYHGVHMILSGNFTEEWREGEERECKLVFIGKDLNKVRVWQQRGLSELLSHAVSLSLSFSRTHLYAFTVPNCFPFYLQAALEASFQECLATKENHAKRVEQLRFQTGTVRIKSHIIDG